MLEGIFTVFIKKNTTFCPSSRNTCSYDLSCPKDSHKAWHGLKGQIRKDSV